MGRRGNMKGRSGILFVSVFAISLIIFYFSWRSLISADTNPKLYRAKEHIKKKPLFELQGRLDSREDFNTDEEHDQDYHDISENKLNSFRNQQKNDLIIEQKNALKQKSFEELVDFEKKQEKQSSKKYYKTFESIGKTVKSMSRLVHLDLKGAAPKLSYLKKIIPLFSKLGATGLLIEYEDMFPYSGILQNISALNSYTKKEIKELLTVAKNYSLAVIPLIQTFGHMEFVLKNAFSRLRESPYTPQVIDITNNSSYELIMEMIRQILLTHPDATHLHIGCDEVYELGRGASSLRKVDREIMFLDHVTKVSKIVKAVGNENNQKIMPIIWDDELRKIQSGIIKSYKLASLVEIMVWHYGGNVLERVNMSVWDKYSTNFKTVWIASAFKGATGSRQFYTEPWFHLQNHFSWLDVISMYHQRLIFRGIAVTGWSRYDHFATLCELLPVALPSLAVCLATMSNAEFSESIHRQTSDTLQCKALIEINFPVIDSKRHTAKVSQDCRFPGHAVYYSMQEFYGYTEINTKSKIEGWLSEYQVSNRFSNPGQLRSLSLLLTKQSSGFSIVSYPLKNSLSEIFSQDTVDEWISENIEERINNIKDVFSKIRILLKTPIWPVRPLKSVKLNFSPADRQEFLQIEKSTFNEDDEKNLNDLDLGSLKEDHSNTLNPHNSNVTVVTEPQKQVTDGSNLQYNPSKDDPHIPPSNLNIKNNMSSFLKDINKRPIRMSNNQSQIYRGRKSEQDKYLEEKKKSYNREYKP